MLRYILCIVYSCFVLIVNGQKKIIDTGSFFLWPEVKNARISDDGNYAAFSVDSGQGKSSAFIICTAKKNNWQLIIPDATSDIVFTDDCKYAIFKNSKDSLGIIQLGKPGIRYKYIVKSFRLSNNWLFFNRPDTVNKLIVYNINTGRELAIENVKKYLLSPTGDVFYFIRNLEGKQLVVSYLLADEKEVVISEGGEVLNYIADGSGKQLALLIKKNNINELWHYNAVTKTFKLIVTDQLISVGGDWVINRIQKFSDEGNSIFFQAQPLIKEKQPSIAIAKVDVWSYKDQKLKSQELFEGNQQRTFLMSVNVSNGKIQKIENEHDRVLQIVNGYVVVHAAKGDAGAAEEEWNEFGKRKLCLVSLTDGSRTYIADNYGVLSPGGRFIIYYDAVQKNYFSYSTDTRSYENITSRIITKWTLLENDHTDSARASYAVVGWLKDDAGVILRDEFDLWLVFLNTKDRQPINLTNGFGKRRKIMFHVASEQNKPVILKYGDEFLLSGFNYISKDNGFYKIKIGEKRDPALLTSGPYAYFLTSNNGNRPGDLPIKARFANAFIVKRMSAGESPNYFYTTDFRTIRPLSNNYPERHYNWLSAELINWNLPAGGNGQGILYKPQNFDTAKKYPIIFYFYEAVSDKIHLFQPPTPSRGPINIPYFVSRGYLVFAPDIHFKIGHPGESALQTVTSAAEYFAKLPWVNRSAMGIQGHSFGGYETNYIVAHTFMFAAACSAAGVADLVGNYGSLHDNSFSKQSAYESGQYRIGQTLWQRRDLFINNSPIFDADKVTTPLLLMNNRNDNAVPFSEGVAFFTALRRLGKKVWLLQYDGEGHIIENNISAIDYTIRVEQFFDHYLKKELPPVWMTKGVNTSLKGVESRFELDSQDLP